MGKTVPIREQNAIDEIAFVILFEKDLDDATLLNLRGLRDEFSDELPNFEISNLVQVHINPDNLSLPVTKENGFVCSKKSNADPARLEWSLRVDTNRIIVACSEYTRWDEVSTKAKRFLFAAIEKCKLELNAVVEIVFQCNDKFSFNGNLNEYRVEEVFNINSDYLTKHVTVNNLFAWHVHQGWFLEDASMQALNNLNLNAHIQAEKPHETIISHLVKIKKSGDTAIKTKEVLCGSNGSMGFLETAMIAAHNFNKQVLLDLLSDNMAKVIGIEG